MPSTALEARACGTCVIATPEAGGNDDIAALALGHVILAEAGKPFVEAVRALEPKRGHAGPLQSKLPPEFVLDRITPEVEGLLERIAR